MAIPGAAVIQNTPQLDALRDVLLRRQRELKNYWRPLSLRQDYWLQMYRLIDVLQQSKPLGVARRFISNEPRTGVDAAWQILTRNPITWRIPLNGAEDENQEMRRRVGRIERTLEGLVYDADELFGMRLQPSLWKQVVFQGLLRGMIWGKFHITIEALQYRRSPLIAEIYDARTVFPHVDQWGLNHVLIEKPTTLGDLAATYPDKFNDLLTSSNYDPHTPALKLEYWSNDRGERKGIAAVLATVGSPVAAGSLSGMAVADTMGKDARWVVPPFFHGYTYDELPVVGVPVNGLMLSHTPPIASSLEHRLQERADLLAMNALAWNGANSSVAELGRSILSSVEEQVPQYNELVATIFQHLTNDTYDTLIFKTPTGDLPEFERGIGAHIPLGPQDSVEKLATSPMPTDAYRLLDILAEERQKGILSNVLQAVTPNLSSGVLLQQITNAALSSIEPYLAGPKEFGTRMGTTILAQMKKAAPIIGMFELQSSTPKKTWFNIEFDPQTELDEARHYRPVPIMKPALPDDLTVRMTAARMALDPRRPMLSLMTVMEEILFVDDPTAEADRLWEDMAMQDPVIILEQMAMALERHGEKEMAARIRDQEFATKFVEEQKLRQITQGAGQGEPPGAAPAAGPLSQSTARDGTERNLPDGAQAAGAAGMRAEV
ncbi:hypothetical protein LCGC14_0289330 [marine sediment metagenome]|uniref:Uncharacterized protein n=1 Tax=marine sediment metagenome TaxID=412755 RepID=A0A0F9WF13_9ZZZZ